MGQRESLVEVLTSRYTYNIKTESWSILQSFLSERSTITHK